MRTRLFIDGQFQEAASGEIFPTRDPARLTEIAHISRAGLEDVDRALAAARHAFDHGPWPRMSPAERAELLRAIADRLESHPDLAELEARDSGGTIRRISVMDVPWAVGTFRAFADLAEHTPEEVDLPFDERAPGRHVVRREPIGVCAGIIPWNFPLLMAAWKVAPAIAAGNTLVLKPACMTPLTALELADVAHRAGLPPGVLNVIPGPGEVVGEALASSPLVDKVAFTGSTAVGRRIMELASPTVKPVLLELGGKSANIVLDDADLDVAAGAVLWAAFIHAGQACEAGTRVLVQRSIFEELTQLLVERAAALRFGDPLDPDSDLGPLASRDRAKHVAAYVAIGVGEVGPPICGGAHPDGLPEGLDREAFYLPTIFKDVDNRARIAQEEIFGPVITVTAFDTDDEAVALANDTIYGLAAGVQSGDVGRARAIARRLQAGTVWINDWHAFDLRAPFGGYKQSGIGRELGRWGFESYQQLKHIGENPALEQASHPPLAVLGNAV
ncbi:MAG: aldehyde dehydrogenase family protein [Thermoleophilia bacterium]|nr:aldehyde dehydrogenase family protein [Thermoleophilia bacterium]MDH3724711.1 aldehyde dehydrogenase family protein [Thermoleophilia bacterium]